MKSSSRIRRFGDLTRPILETILYWKIQHFALRLSIKIFHQVLHLPRKVTLQLHQILRLPRKMNHDWSASHMKRHLQCAEQQTAHHNFTKYCACHAKWLSWLIRVTYETSFTMRGASTVSFQPHQILRLARNLYSSTFQRKPRELLPPIERRFDDIPTIIRR